MRHDDIGRLFAYWNGLRGGRAAPERREIAPAALGARLPYTFILQTSGSGEPRFRLAGTRICSIHGRELSTLPFTSIWQPKDRNSILRLVKNCMTSKKAVQLDCEGRSARNRKTLFKFVLLPLASEANERHLMGMMTVVGRPFWLESDAIVENQIQTVSIIDPHHSRHEADLALSAPANAAPHSASRTLVSRRVAHLRVIEGGRIKN
ncbi:MAG: PAS domain-containing protein [Phyllobacterium sp.]|uniref:PAS domain-containing protein n=1 Tax=Phyllobacterium sp. TaxID=1871046 RepID=UPI0030F35BF6